MRTPDKTTLWLAAALAALALTAGCSSDKNDGGDDTGPSDAGPHDSGNNGNDAGSQDTGSSNDAGSGGGVKSGAVTVTKTSAASYSVSAGFNDSTPGTGTCTDETDGDCVFKDCSGVTGGTS